MKNPYTLLSTLAILTVPLAPVFFFGWQVHTEVYATSQSYWLSAPVGLLSAIGLEIIGILAGHLAMEFWRSGNMGRAYLSGGVMSIYVVIGVWELWGTIGAVMFVIAPLVYVLVALQDVATVEATEHARNEKRSMVIDYRAKEAAAERQHNLELERLRLANEVKLAKVQAGTMPALPAQEPAQSKLDLHKCGKCQRDFATVQGLNAHQRFCAGGVPLEPAHTNGVQKAVLS